MSNCIPGITDVDEIEKGKIEYEEVPVYDAVHGFVNITSVEKRIINSIFFQRLREIKQLSFAYYVFPGAVHTRFAHSIGVLAITQKILDRLQQVNPNYFTAKDVKKLRMAALLHDIGHYPFSHVIERVYKANVKELLQFLDEDIEGKATDFELQQRLSGLPQEVIDEIIDGHHERLGATIILNTNFEGGITEILLDDGYFTKDDVEDIAKIVQGKSLTTWYSQIIHSELDADRLDYLLRDSYSTGVQYGNFDFEYLIENCRLVQDQTSGNLVFAFKSSAVFAIEHFLLSRYFWYAQIIYERTISIFNHMAFLLYRWLMKHGAVPDYIQVLHSISNPICFLKFNDSLFWDRVYWIIESKEAANLDGYPFFKELAEMLVRRVPLKRLDISIRKQVRFKNNTCIKRNECNRQNSCSKLRQVDNHVTEEFYKLLSDFQNCLERNEIDSSWVQSIYFDISVSKTIEQRDADECERDSIRIIERDQSIQMLDKQLHSIVSTLSEQELIIPRIYIKKEYEDMVRPQID